MLTIKLHLMCPIWYDIVKINVYNLIFTRKKIISRKRNNSFVYWARWTLWVGLSPTRSMAAWWKFPELDSTRLWPGKWGNQPTKVRPFRVKSHVRLQTNRFCHCLNAAFSVMRWGCHRQKVTQEFQFESSKVPSSTEIVAKGFSGNWPQDAKILICLGIIASKPNSETSKVPSSSMQVNAKILLFDQITSIGYDPNSESSRASSSREIVV